MRFLSRTCTTCQPANSMIMLSRPGANARTHSLFSRSLVTKRRMIHGSTGVNGDDEVTTPQSKSPPISSKSTSSQTAPTLPPIPTNAHRFILMRHGESEFNNANIFTGWCDVALTQRGVVESVEAGQVFLSHALNFRKCYTSALTRSIVTAHRCLEAAGVAYTPVVYDWRLNERHYGALQGLSKERTAQRLGYELVMQWRRSYSARPPLMTPEHPHYKMINEDARYYKYQQNGQDLQIPLGESLQECQERVVQAWQDIVQEVADAEQNGTANNSSPSYSLVVAHANSLRALVIHLDDIPADQIEGLNIPTAIPFYYDIDLKTGRRVIYTDECDEKDTFADRFRGVYISDERKKRNFLERRRAANDPFLWALHDHQVARGMLLDDGTTNDDDTLEGDSSGLEGIELEARHNTEIFSPLLKDGKMPQF